MSGMPTIIKQRYITHFLYNDLFVNILKISVDRVQQITFSTLYWYILLCLFDLNYTTFLLHGFHKIQYFGTISSLSIVVPFQKFVNNSCQVNISILKNPNITVNFLFQKVVDHY